MTHESRFRVYYEDTDMAGIVYYANYLKFMERGRSDAVRALGIDQMAMRDRDGVVFAVAQVSVTYISPARFDDILIVRTRTTRVGGASLEMVQEIHVDERPVVTATVRIVAMTPEGKVSRLPKTIRQALAKDATLGE